MVIQFYHEQLFTRKFMNLKILYLVVLNFWFLNHPRRKYPFDQSLNEAIQKLDQAN